MSRQEQIERVTRTLEEIGLQFAHSVAVALVDAGIGDKDRFEKLHGGISPILYKEER